MISFLESEEVVGESDYSKKDKGLKDRYFGENLKNEVKKI